MSAEDNKQLIANYFDLQRTGRLDELFDLLSEDFVLRGMGMPPFEFVWSKERMRELLRERASFQPDPINIVINGTTAEGERVAVEGERRDSLRDGTSYNNRYHFLFIVRGGLITRIDEYLCTYSYSEYQKKVTHSS